MVFPVLCLIALNTFGQNDDLTYHKAYASLDYSMIHFTGIDYALHYAYKGFIVECGYTHVSRKALSTPDDYNGTGLVLGVVYKRPKDIIKGPELMLGYQMSLSNKNRVQLSVKSGMIFSKISTPYEFIRTTSSGLFAGPNYNFDFTHHYSNGLLIRADLTIPLSNAVGASWGIKYYNFAHQDIINKHMLCVELRVLAGMLYRE